MRTLDKIYIDGQFVTPHGEELFDLFNPATEAQIGQVRLGDAEDARAAVVAAKRAFPAFSRTSKQERIAMLHRLHDAVAARAEAMAAAMVEEYGAPAYFVDFSARRSASVFLDMAKTLEDFDFHQTIGRAEVTLQPLGVVAAIIPWNSNYGFICGKLAGAIAAGCTIVIKPSEMSALQTSVLMPALHEAGLPPGVFNIVNGRGDVVGAELTSHPDVAKVTFRTSDRKEIPMRTLDKIYIDGRFVAPHGQELFDLFNPATKARIGQVRLGDAEDARAAVAAAKRAFPAFSRTSKQERIAMLHRLHDAVAARAE
ncbi:MAG TPA: aldehyde dehydrogenase family protein, partial [Phenylobacterium sp.]|uniref:aldehyde dehydrogenase family protein n=1 Tax=Phenylobacterium sp. TaxID=1871053 RepID=UPI002D5C1C8E